MIMIINTFEQLMCQHPYFDWITPTHVQAHNQHIYSNWLNDSWKNDSDKNDIPKTDLSLSQGMAGGTMSSPTKGIDGALDLIFYIFGLLWVFPRVVRCTPFVLCCLSWKTSFISFFSRDQKKDLSDWRISKRTSPLLMKCLDWALNAFATRLKPD